MAGESIDNLMPRDVALKAENAGVIKANLDVFSTVMLALLAGAFIGFGAVFSTTVMTGNGLDGAVKLPFGLVRLVGGSVFCLGLILVTIAGAEMFTGNVLLVMAAASRKISAGKLLRNWGIVFGGNFLGAALTAGLVFLSGQYLMLHGQVGVTALEIAELKGDLSFVQAMTRAIFCNVLVCLAYWLSISGRSVIDKVVVILFPITAFVASGFEHSVANMYFLSIALLIKSFGPAEFWAAAHAVPAQFPHVTLERFLIGNLMPVTLGNTIGGLMVGLMYWGIYCRPNIMMRSNDRGLLAGLTLDGRRRFKRIEADGLVTLHFRGQEFHGKLRNIGEGGASAEFYEARGLPNVGDELSLDIVLNDVAERFDAVPAVVMQQREGKNLMGRRYFVFSMMFGELSQRSGDTLKRLVQQAFRAR
ncbi:MAG: formate/nitrite transporter family protein [Methylotetracoccus sp.]|nr:formate/nitrite transporter family protein [Methylotetracoccus sp.]